MLYEYLLSVLFLIQCTGVWGQNWQCKQP